MYAINYLSFNEDGNLLVTCSMDKSIKIWDAAERKLLKVIDKARNAGHGTSINKVVWSTYNGNVISVSDDRTISIWQIQVNNS
jgi:WD40 repeat protein